MKSPRTAANFMRSASVVVRRFCWAKAAKRHARYQFIKTVVAVAEPGFVEGKCKARSHLACHQDHQWLKAGGKQRMDSTHLLAPVRDMNHLECVAETIHFTINSLAMLIPDWLARPCNPSGPPGTAPEPRSIACRSPPAIGLCAASRSGRLVASGANRTG